MSEALTMAELYKLNERVVVAAYARRREAPYWRRGHEVRTEPGGVLYIRADHPDKAERICRALNALAKLEAKNAACGWPTEWVDSA